VIFSSGYLKTEIYKTICGSFVWIRNLVSDKEACKLKVFQNRLLRKMFGTKRDEVIGWRQLHNLYSSPNIIRVIKSRRMKWTGHMSHVGVKRNV
jgi:hypothetical protein